MIRAARKTVSASEFRAKVFRLLDHLGPEGMIISKRGRPIARVMPVATVDNAKTIGSMKGKIIVKGDLFSTGVKAHP